MGNKFNYRSQFDSIMLMKNALIEELKNLDTPYCSYFAIPPVLAKDEMEIRSEIITKPYFGEIAFNKCCHAFTNVYRENEHSGRVLNRYPGIIVVNTSDPTSIINRIIQINEAKLSFKKMILEIGNNDSRFEAVHNAIPNVLTLAVYRQIHFEHNAPFSVRFTWMHKHSVKTFTKDEAMTLLKNSENYGVTNKINAEAWRALVNQEILRVASLSDKEKLRIRRPTPASPQVNVRFDAKNRYHVSAALPFILINPKEDVKLGQLPDYIKKETDPRKLKPESLVERLFLQRY